MATGSTSHSSSTSYVPAYTAPAQNTPTLEQGDRLTGVEFLRRYESMPEVKKAELIKGIVHMPSPVRFSQHGKPHWNLIGWLCTYEARTEGVLGGDNTTLKLDNDNVPQPDALLMIDPAQGGQAKIDDQGYVQGAPELIAEVASSSVSLDMHDKLQVYRRAGVCEYLVWRVLDQAIDWFVLREGEFIPLEPTEEGILRSENFPGLWLHTKAMLAGELDAVLATLQQAMEAKEHKSFVEQLAKRKKQ